VIVIDQLDIVGQRVQIGPKVGMIQPQSAVHDKHGAALADTLIVDLGAIDIREHGVTSVMLGWDSGSVYFNASDVDFTIMSMASSGVALFVITATRPSAMPPRAACQPGTVGSDFANWNRSKPWA